MPPCVWYCPEEQNTQCTHTMRLSPYLGVSEGPNNNLTRKLNDKVNNKKQEERNVWTACHLGTHVQALHRFVPKE